VGFLDSPRRRRRLLRLAIVLVVLTAVGVVSALFWNTGKPIGTSTTPDTEAVEVPAEQHQVRLTAATRREVHVALTRFVATAVTRRNVAASFGLVTPKLRAGMSRKEWERGDIPVYPYPARRDVEISRFVGSFRDDVLLDVLLQPRPGAKTGPVAFEVEMKAVGSGSHRRWLVDSFVPSAAFAPASAQPAKPAKPAAPTKPKIQTTARGPDYGEGHLSARWILLPVLILALILLVPLGFGLRSWYIARRAAREFARERPLPPLRRD
jgi:hypothetical protein